LKRGKVVTSRRDFLVGLSLAVGAGACGPGQRALAQSPPATGGVLDAPVDAPLPEATPFTGPQFATPTTLDRVGRIVAPVRIGAHTALRFVLDTGANRSAIPARTAALIGVAATSETIVHGITGAAVMPQAVVPEFLVGDLRFEQHRLAILPDAVFAGVDGIIGIDALQNARVDVDFGRDIVTVRRSTNVRPKGWLVVRATVRHRGLLLIPGRVGRVPVKAIVDTGAQRSLGNAALFAELSRRDADANSAPSTTVVGATAQVAEGRTFRTPPISLGGGAHIGDLPVTFADFHVFHVWGLLAEPALVIGMDVLGTLTEFSIDYPRREFQLRVDRRLPPVQFGAPD
jgi:predicted aspartyl protease